MQLNSVRLRLRQNSPPLKGWWWYGWVVVGLAAIFVWGFPALAVFGLISVIYWAKRATA